MENLWQPKEKKLYLRQTNFFWGGGGREERTPASSSSSKRSADSCPWSVGSGGQATAWWGSGQVARWPGRAHEGHFGPAPGPAVAKRETGNEGLAGGHLTASQHAQGQAWWPPINPGLTVEWASCCPCPDVQCICCYCPIFALWNHFNIKRTAIAKKMQSYALAKCRD